MSIQRSPGMDRATAEQLVAGEGVGPVASVLRAAVAPAHRDELAGEDAVVAAFRAAATVVPSSPPRFRRALAKALTIKAAIVVAIAGSAGIVLAASEGALPVPWSDSPAVPPATNTTTNPMTNTTTNTTTNMDTTAPSPEAPAPTPSGTRSPDRGRPSTAPDPAIVGLCNAYTGPGADKNLDSPAFRALVEAAGGKDEVAGYCEVVEAAEPGRPTGQPTPGGGAGPEPGRPGNDVIPPNPPKGKPPGKPERTATTTTEPAGDTTKKHPGKKTPVAPPFGAATAVPPSGAEPPSTGG